MREVICMVFIFLIGIAVGAYLVDLHYKRVLVKAKVGNLNLDHSVPGEVNPMAEFEVPIEEIEKKSYILMTVSMFNYLTEEEKNNDC